MDWPKRERLREFYRRLNAAAPVSTNEMMFQLYCRLLNEVEDELTAIPHNPAMWMTDGRLYPPQPDRMVPPPGPGMTAFRSRRHLTCVGHNGSLEIARLDGYVEFRKPGADGRHLWEQVSSEVAG